MKTFAKFCLGCGIVVVLLVIVGIVLIKGVFGFFSGLNFTTGPAQGVPSTPDGYQVEGDQVFYTRNNNFFGNWMPQRTIVEGADAKTFTIIESDTTKYPQASNTTYGKDATHVYYDAQRIVGADPATFVAHDWPFAADRAHVFFKGVIIEKADPSTWVPIAGCLARFRDKNHVFARDRIIEGADPATYEPVGDGRLGRDKADYYLRNNDDYDNGEFALHVRDMGSFKLLIPAVPPERNNPWEDLWAIIWAHDNQAFYVGDKVIPIADPATWQSLGQGYAKDAKQVYYLHHILADADPKTFEVVSPNHDPGWAKSFAGYAKDSKTVYHHERVLEDADAATFVVIDEREFKDKHHRYNQGYKAD